MRPESIPLSTAVFTDGLADADLPGLLRAAEINCWPSNTCAEAWSKLRNWAIQTESFMLDRAENAAWEQQMRDLALEGLPYEAWIERRMEALRDRTRARKLAQGRIRDRYGYKRERRWRLVARDVRRLHASLCSPHGDTT